MRYFIVNVILFLSLSEVLMGQTSGVTSYDGVPYSVGDTIMLGFPRDGADSFDFIFIEQANGGVSNYSKLQKESFSLSYAVIEQVAPKEDNKVSGFMEESPMLVARCYDKSDALIYINLDYALAQKEIAHNVKTPSTGDVALKKHTILAFYHKIYKNEIDDDILLEYIESKNSDLGKTCRDNGFEFEKIKTEWLNKFEEEAESLDFNKVYYLELPVNYSDYDFDKNGYNLYFNSDVSSDNKGIISVDPFYLRIKNQAYNSFLPMSADVAKRFEITQKGVSYYSWQGTLYGRVFLRFEKLPVKYPNTKEGIAMSVIYEDKMMDITVEKIDVYDHNSYLYNYIGTVN